jgi:hypothetical protein
LRPCAKQDGAEDEVLDAIKDDEDLDATIHLTSVEVAGFTLVRRHANKVLVVGSDGEVLCEKEINNEKHWEHFLQKFRDNQVYRNSCIGGHQ